jgi:hypothetical protein
MLDNNEVTRLKKLAISSITEQEPELSEQQGSRLAC